MRRIAFAAFIALICGAWWQSVPQQSVSGFTPSCSQSSAFFARAPSITGTDLTNYDTLICGLETDGIGCSTHVDGLWVLAAPNSTVAVLNLCSASFSLTVIGAPTFTANRGYSAGDSSNYLQTGFNPSTSGGHQSTNSLAISVYVRTEGSGGFIEEMGGSGGGGQTFISSNFASLVFAGANGASGPSGSSGGTALGQVVVSRTGATTTDLYKNGSSIGSDSTSATDTAAAIYILCNNSGGTPGACSDRQVAAAMISAGLNATQAANYSSRVNTFMKAVGASVY